MTVGAVAEPALRRGSDYAQLSRRISQAGLLNRRPGWYVAKIALTVGLFAAGWVSLVLVGDSWWQLLVAVLLAIGSTQVAFLGHDAGHRQMFRNRRASEVAGLLAANLAVGLSYGWWIDKHNRHHANPNHEDHDPDVGAGALVWTDEQARERRGFGHWLARHQAYLFFPMLTLEGLNLHYASFQGLFRAPMRYRAVEAVLLVAHVAAYLGVVFAVLSPVKALVFIAVHQGLWGVYMGCSFAPNHKGMPVLTAEDDLDFLRKQVLTSRNVRGSRVVDFALGGLNYQIEHHLFPSMPRSNLRKAQPIVRQYCAEQGIPYEEAGLLDSYAQALRHLHSVGAGLRADR
ncbi:fatty acid desaturase family protein [Micromonospora sp. NPDC050417]|uniref:fatty acid desaturase family protein n=1 Tax=Micromonospora sp. NPDC050417 TaxID=3364280 RepID=UPI0037970630